MEGTQQITHSNLEDVFATGIEGVDQSISFWLNSFNTPWSDQFWYFMSRIPVWIPLYVAVAALLLWRLGWKRGLVAIACVALAFFCTERLVNFTKDIVQRVRPCNNEGLLSIGLHVLENGGGWSFPSGHSCNTFGFAASSSLCLKMDERKNWSWYAVFIFIWAALVSISRVMVARHFFGDVLVGCVLGTFIGIIWAYIASLIIRRYHIK